MRANKKTAWSSNKKPFKWFVTRWDITADTDKVVSKALPEDAAVSLEWSLEQRAPGNVVYGMIRAGKRKTR